MTRTDQPRPELPEERREAEDSPLAGDVEIDSWWMHRGLRDERSLEILAQLRAYISVIDEKGQMLYVSPSASVVTGFSPKELRLRRRELLHPDDAPKLPSFAKRRTGAKVVFRMRHRDGHWLWLQTVAYTTFRGPDGRLLGLSLTQDVSEVERARAALRQSEERYRVLAEASRDVITEIDENGRFAYASANATEVFGYSFSELEALSPANAVHPEDRKRVTEALQRAIRNEKSTWFPPYRLRRGDGAWRWFETTGVPYHRADGRRRFLALSRDVTERVRAEEQRSELADQMRDAQRLESLGVMAAGIAHDFNNLLTPILGEASLSLMDLPTESPVRTRQLRIQRAARRASTLTQQLLAYAGADSPRWEALDLTRLVAEMGQLLRGAVSGKAVLVTELPKDLPPVLGDSAQLSQVVMNMITNAAEAVGDGEGRVCIRTGVEEIETASPNGTRLGAELSPGLHVYFEVEDTGCGMDAETRARIFDPFFTTKFTGRGIGLAAVLGIVRSHGGAIESESEPGKGSRFRVLFPARASAGAARAPAEESEEPDPWRGEGTILVVDDEEGVRELAADILGRAGFSVLTAVDGSEAVERFRAHADEIRLVLLDRTMPKTSGEEAFREMRRVRADVPIVLLSGYTEKRAAARLRELGLAGFIEKPFLPGTLIERVREALER